MHRNGGSSLKVHGVLWDLFQWFRMRCPHSKSRLLMGLSLMIATNPNHRARKQMLAKMNRIGSKSKWVAQLPGGNSSCKLPGVGLLVLAPSTPNNQVAGLRSHPINGRLMLQAAYCQIIFVGLLIRGQDYAKGNLENVLAPSRPGVLGRVPRDLMKVQPE